MFYSISNCQRGLAGVSFGNFLIKQVVEDICRDLPAHHLRHAVAGAEFRRLARARRARRELASRCGEADKAAFAALDPPDWWRDPKTAERCSEPLMRAAAWYFLRASNGRGLPADPVARFHLGNGARLERINWLGDTSERAMQQAHGLMVNYHYDLDDIEKNHEAFAENRTVVASSTVQRHLRTRRAGARGGVTSPVTLRAAKKIFDHPEVLACVKHASLEGPLARRSLRDSLLGA